MVMDKLQLMVYIVQLIAIQLQHYQNNLFSTTMQLHYNAHENFPFCLYVHHTCFRGMKFVCKKHEPMK